jgi:predicted metal-dependent hydrolase
MGTFRVGGKVVRYTVRENGDSKYLVLNLRKDRVLEISLPRKSGLSVKKILEKKRSWIERKYEEVSKRKRAVGRKRILYRGQEYPLKIVQRGKQNVWVQGDKITINVEGGQSARKALREWMSRKSKKYSMRKAAKFAKSLGINPDYTVETKDMKSWGRCVDKKHLVFNWQLIALPPRLAEYAVAHELVHLVEGSHSKKFERKLAVICPQYRELREELKNYLL